MIYNRTQADVDNAKKIRAEKVQTFQELTETDLYYLERGSMTINTLNRIENAQEELKNLINSIGYWDTPIINKRWTNADMFDKSEYQRIIDNTNILRNAFFVYKSTPDTPKVSYYYDDINALEKILHDIDIMINDIKSYYKKCGEIQCGEV